MRKESLLLESHMLKWHIRGLKRINGLPTNQRHETTKTENSKSHKLKTSEEDKNKWEKTTRIINEKHMLARRQAYTNRHPRKKERIFFTQIRK